MTKQPSAKGSSFLAPIPMADLKPILCGATAAMVTLLALGLFALSVMT